MSKGQVAVVLGALCSHRGLLGGSQQRFLSYLGDAEITDALKAPHDNELIPFRTHALSLICLCLSLDLISGDGS